MRRRSSSGDGDGEELEDGGGGIDESDEKSEEEDSGEDEEDVMVVNVFVTFHRPEDAHVCINCLHLFSFENTFVIRACTGTTKYCHTFLKGRECKSDKCTYLHDRAADSQCFSQQRLNSLPPEKNPTLRPLFMGLDELMDESQHEEGLGDDLADKFSIFVFLNLSFLVDL